MSSLHDGSTYKRRDEKETQMFDKRSDDGFEEMFEGISRKTLAYGEKTLMTEFRLKKGSILPRHAHPHEQTGYLVSGRVNIQVGEETFEAEPGDSWSIAGDLEHGAEPLMDSVVVEVFSPVREDYLPD
jgi:quercetin dioxygenase-like cupin family protein